MPRYAEEGFAERGCFFSFFFFCLLRSSRVPKRKRKATQNCLTSSMGLSEMVETPGFKRLGKERVRNGVEGH